MNRNNEWQVYLQVIYMAVLVSLDTNTSMSGFGSHVFSYTAKRLVSYGSIYWLMILISNKIPKKTLKHTPDIPKSKYERIAFLNRWLRIRGMFQGYVGIFLDDYKKRLCRSVPDCRTLNAQPQRHVVLKKQGRLTGCDEQCFIRFMFSPLCVYSYMSSPKHHAQTWHACMTLFSHSVPVSNSAFIPIPLPSTSCCKGHGPLFPISSFASLPETSTKRKAEAQKHQMWLFHLRVLDVNKTNGSLHRSLPRWWNGKKMEGQGDICSQQKLQSLDFCTNFPARL